MTSKLVFLPAAAILALTATASAQNAADGRQIASRQCQVCHGLDGIATIPVAPNLAAEAAIYLQAQLKAFRSGERVNEMMSVVAKDLSDADIASVAAWYESIRIVATIPE